MKHRRYFLLMAILFLFQCTGCTPRTKSATKTLFAMDTVMTLTAYGAHAEEAIAVAAEKLFELDRLLSVTHADSEIYRMNAAGGEAVTLSPEVYSLIKAAVTYSEEFCGYYDLTVKPLVEAWGFYDDDYSVPDAQELRALLETVDFHNVVLEEAYNVHLLHDAQLDLGGIAKGYAAELVRAIFEDHQIESAVLDLGGNVLTMGEKADGTPWRVAVRSPFHPDEQLCILSVPEKVLVTSGSYQRFFEADGVRYHHILDPRTGTPADSDLLSVTVITEDAVYADALSTALFVMGYDRAVDYWREHGTFEAVFVRQTGEVYCTPSVLPWVEATDLEMTAVK